MEPGNTSDQRIPPDSVEQQLLEEIRFWSGLIADGRFGAGGEVPERAWDALSRAHHKLIQYRLGRSRAH